MDCTTILALVNVGLNVALVVIVLILWSGRNKRVKQFYRDMARFRGEMERIITQDKA